MIIWAVFLIVALWFLISITWGKSIGKAVEKIMEKWGSN